MRLWSYGTSPHGLGLSAEVLWECTPREYYALRDIQQAPVERWAIQQALTVNMQLASGVEPFTAADFMGTGNREQRVAARQRGEVEVMKENRKISAIRPIFADEDEPEDLPVWARMTPAEKARRPRRNGSPPPPQATPLQIPRKEARPMESIGSVSVDIVADYSKMQSGFRDATSEAQKAGSQISSAFTSAVSPAQALAAATEQLRVAEEAMNSEAAAILQQMNAASSGAGEVSSALGQLEANITAAKAAVAAATAAMNAQTAAAQGMGTAMGGAAAGAMTLQQAVQALQTTIIQQSAAASWRLSATPLWGRLWVALEVLLALPVGACSGCTPLCRCCAAGSRNSMASGRLKST